MASSNLVGVVTVTYNSASVLHEFLRCMVAQSHSEFLLFAVDNASKDDTLRILHECSDVRLHVIANPDNRGVAAGNNQGIRAALELGCSEVLLINNDTEFGTALVADLKAGLASHQVDMACPKMMYFDAPDRIWAAGGTFRFWSGPRSIHFGEGETDRGQFDQTRLVNYVPTCCVLIKAEVFKMVGLMDERYFVYWDDADFMYRAMKVGIKLLYLPKAKLLHKVGSLTGVTDIDTPFAIRFGTRNSLFFMLKHFGIIPVLPWLALSQAIWCLRFSLGRKPQSWFAMKQSAFRESLSMWWYGEDKSAA